MDVDLPVGDRSGDGGVAVDGEAGDPVGIERRIEVEVAVDDGVARPIRTLRNRAPLRPELVAPVRLVCVDLHQPGLALDASDLVVGRLVVVPQAAPTETALEVELADRFRERQVDVTFRGDGDAL